MIEVISISGPALVQDLGRPGYQSLGVSLSGAADRGAHRLANRLVGNSEDRATIELGPGSLALRADRAVTVAGAGASRAGLPWLAARSLAAGTTLVLGPPDTGVRSYLAVRGGIAVQPVLGSRSTDTLSGLGPTPLQAGDRLPIGLEASGEPSDAGLVRPPSSGPLRVIPGPRQDWFVAPEQLYRVPWQVQPASNRVGLRLDDPSTGRRLLRSRGGELPSEPTMPGAIQVPRTAGPSSCSGTPRSPVATR